METIPAKTIITRVKKPGAWFGALYNMNIYRGCSHGCVYCDSRSDCYRNPDFGTVKAKQNALQIIRDDFRRKVKKGVVGTGAMSDPYNPFEREQKLTRNALELINAYEFGVAVDTKGSLVARDIDILRDIKKHSPVIVKMTITTADDGLCKQIEPGAPPSSERFEALSRLSEAGIFCGVLMMPILPFVNDTVENVTGIAKQAKEAGAKFVSPSFGMTLRDGNREYYYANLDRLFPGVREKYERTFGSLYMCASPHAKALSGAFRAECEKQGLLHGMNSITAAYKQGYNEQLSLF